MRWQLFTLLAALALAPSCGEDVSLGADCFHGVCVGCDAELCPDGCCRGGRCMRPSAAACGVGGAACFDCGELGDGCSPEGECLCGAEPCAPGEVCVEAQCLCGDEPGCGPLGRCVDGECRCGARPACNQGQRCDGARCFCDSLSCPGCCWGGVTCQPEPSAEACGFGGEECRSCLLGERCEGGRCGCGGGDACAAERADRCDPQGECRCGGSPACSAELSDRCEGGECRCGEGVACQEPSRCEEGRCRCDQESCPLGCCAEDGLCLESTPESCGLAGRPCVDCSDPAALCTPLGDCLCSGIPCPPMSRCVDGACL